MLYFRSNQILVCLLCSLLFLTACGGQEKTKRWDKAQEESSQPKKEEPAPPKPVVTGGSLNQFFPKASGGYDVVPSQEKEGFAEYKLKKDGKEMAMLALSDVFNNTEALNKYKQSSKTIAGYPAVDQGNTASALLVAGRYQVKVLSRDSSFSKDDREAWLQKFDLAGLSKLK